MGTRRLTPISLWHDTVHIENGFIISLAQSRKGQGENESLWFTTHHHLDNLGETQRMIISRPCSRAVQVSERIATKFSHQVSFKLRRRSPFRNLGEAMRPLYAKGANTKYASPPEVLV